MKSTPALFFPLLAFGARISHKQVHMHTAASGEEPTDAAPADGTGVACQPLSANEVCARDAGWAYRDGRHQSWAEEAYAMLDVPMSQATQDDFQKLFYCGMDNQCPPPCSCSKPPCNVCHGMRVPDNLEDATQMASYLNKRYYDFKGYDKGSAAGVYMTMDDRLEIYNDMGCWAGAWTNTRMSASVYNHEMMLTAEGARNPKITMGRDTGFVFSAPLIESKLAKCSYMFDGATFNRFNGACGCNSKVSKCGEKGTAFLNQCGGGHDHTCSPADDEVEHCSCDHVTDDKIPTRSDQVQCFFKGPAYDRDHISKANDQIRWMIDERFERQNTSSSHGPQLEFWNELIIDTVLLAQQLKESPNGVLHAFTWVKSHPSAEARATKMRDSFMAQWGITTKIPVIGINDKADVTKKEPVYFVR